MAHYLVTGAAGFIGSAVARRLIEKGHKVTTIDNLSTGNAENIPEKVSFIKGDCQDKSIYPSLRKTKFDAILHIAGQSSGEISFDDPVYDLQSNTQSTLLLLKFALETGCKRIIYASSMSVYGDQPDRATGENAVCTPKSFYAVGKLASEHYLRIFQQYGINSTSLRLFNVYGPNQNMGNLRQGMISIFLAQAIKNKHVLIKGSLDRYRDFIYIDDVVDAFEQCILDERTYNNVFNIGTGSKTSVEEVIKLIKKNLPYKITWECLGTTPGDMLGIYADISKANEKFGFTPKILLGEGLKEMVSWALGHKKEYK